MQLLKLDIDFVLYRNSYILKWHIHVLAFNDT